MPSDPVFPVVYVLKELPLEKLEKLLIRKRGRELRALLELGAGLLGGIFMGLYELALKNLGDLGPELDLDGIVLNYLALEPQTMNLMYKLN